MTSYDGPEPIELTPAQLDQVHAMVRDLQLARARVERARMWLWIATTINLVACALNIGLIAGRALA